MQGIDPGNDDGGGPASHPPRTEGQTSSPNSPGVILAMLVLLSVVIGLFYFL